MADQDLHLVYLQRLDTWLELSKLNPERLPLLKHMGMTVDQFIDWRLDGTLPKEES